MNVPMRHSSLLFLAGLVATLGEMPESTALVLQLSEYVAKNDPRQYSHWIIRFLWRFSFLQYYTK